MLRLRLGFQSVVSDGDFTVIGATLPIQPDSCIGAADALAPDSLIWRKDGG